jgi:hypothetical protein
MNCYDKNIWFGKNAGRMVATPHHSPPLFGERAVADRAMTVHARSKIRSRVITKSAGSEEPVFISMDV